MIDQLPHAWIIEPDAVDVDFARLGPYKNIEESVMANVARPHFVRIVQTRAGTFYMIDGLTARAVAHHILEVTGGLGTWQPSPWAPDMPASPGPVAIQPRPGRQPASRGHAATQRKPAQAGPGLF